jgi:hypothetical protein
MRERWVVCSPPPKKPMPWVSSLFAAYKLDLSKSDHVHRREACKKAVTVKYAG